MHVQAVFQEPRAFVLDLFDKTGAEPGKAALMPARWRQEESQEGDPLVGPGEDERVADDASTEPVTFRLQHQSEIPFVAFFLDPLQPA